MTLSCSCGVQYTKPIKVWPLRCQCGQKYILNSETLTLKEWIEPPAPPQNGPGTQLKMLLADLGIRNFSGCSCKSKSAQMNRWGVEGCREHFNEICEWIDEARKNVNWSTKIIAAITATTNGLAFRIDPTDVAGSLVRIAIERAENATLQS